jgi:hypothetical protein
MENFLTRFATISFSRTILYHWDMRHIKHPLSLGLNIKIVLGFNSLCYQYFVTFVDCYRMTQLIITPVLWIAVLFNLYINNHIITDNELVYYGKWKSNVTKLSVPQPVSKCVATFWIKIRLYVLTNSSENVVTAVISSSILFSHLTGLCWCLFATMLFLNVLHVFYIYLLQHDSH